MKVLPYFEGRFDDGGISKKSCQYVYKLASDFLNDLLGYSDLIFEFCMEIAGRRQREADNTLRALTRHNLVYLDGVSVLLASGCSEVSDPLLRSILEATFGIAHIVQERSDERALAYQLVRIKRCIKHLRRGDLTHQDGRRLEAELANDTFVPAVLSRLPSNLNLGAKASEIERRLNGEAKFTPILAEWDRLKHPAGGRRQKDPEWYTLFGGAKDIRELSKQLQWQSLYDFLYRNWSNSVHAGNAIDTALTAEKALSPLRYPAQYANSFSLAYALIINGLEKLAGFYDSAKQEEVIRIVVHKIEPEHLQVRGLIEKAFGEFK